MSLYNDKPKTSPKSLLETYLASPELDFKDIIGITCDLLLAGIDTVREKPSYRFQMLLLRGCLAVISRIFNVYIKRCNSTPFNIFNT